MSALYILDALLVLAFVGSILLNTGKRCRKAEGWLILATILSLVAIIFAGIGTVERSVDERNCDYAARQYGQPTKWDFWAGCFIRVNGRFIRLDSYRIIVNENSTQRGK